MLDQPMAQQELTPEQIMQQKSIYKRYLMFLLIVLLVAVLITIGLFINSAMKAEKAKEKIESYKTKLKSINVTDDMYSIYLIQNLRAQDKYRDAKQGMSCSFMVGALVLFIGSAIVMIVFRIKYPFYFTNKKYKYNQTM